MVDPSQAARRPIWAANLHGRDYRACAAALGPPVAPILDVHAHINGREASRLYGEVARLFGVVRTYTQSIPAKLDEVRDALGERVRFVATPNYMDPDRGTAMREGFLKNIAMFREKYDARILKIWNAPSFRDRFVDGTGDDLVHFDSPWRVKVAEMARDLGMMIMVHVADPDTWFRTKYADAGKYGTKRAQYEPLERMLDRFTFPWIAAHLGGWPEDLEFLDGLLSRHPNLYLDTSATKWIVREVSRHPRERVVEFFTRWQGRLLFGSDIVTTDDHLSPAKSPQKSHMADLASGPEEAFELYASRYYALRTLWESKEEGPSPIADPDLMMTEPEKFTAMSAPALNGRGLPAGVLRELYHDAAARLFAEWERR